MLIKQIKQFLAIPGASTNWLWDSVLFPFLVTRSIWELIAYYVRGNYLLAPYILHKIQVRGYFQTRIVPLDIFVRWDSNWYLSIIQNGYQAPANFNSLGSNMGFFPLYPYLVKSIGWFGVNLPNGFYIAVGLILSNLCFLASAALLYRLIVVSAGFDESVARRTLGLLFVFPASFFYSAFYPESLFFFLALGAFTFALQDKWFFTGICMALAVVTRPPGFVLVIVLGWLYMEKHRWKLREIRASALWFALAPIALLLHFYELYRISGHPFAFFEVMTAWFPSQDSVFQRTFQYLQNPMLNVYKIDFVLVILFVSCSLYICWKWSVKAYGAFAIIMCVLSLSTGSLLVSISREYVVIFPVFILLGEKLKRRELYLSLMAVWFALQVIYFAGWVNGYWIA